MKRKIEVGQIWHEKHKRPDYPARRYLRITDIGQHEMSHQPGDKVEITPFTYDHGVRLNELKPSPRPMSFFGLRKNWKFVS